MGFRWSRIEALVALAAVELLESRRVLLFIVCFFLRSPFIPGPNVYLTLHVCSFVYVSVKLTSFSKHFYFPPKKNMGTAIQVSSRAP